MKQLADKFTREAARASHKKAMQEAIEAGDAELIAAMPSEAELIAKNEAAHKQIRERVRRIRVSVVDDLEAVTTRAIELILVERAEAEAALLELYKSRGLAEPIPAAIGDSYTRRCQELRNYTQIFGAGGAAIAPTLVELG